MILWHLVQVAAAADLALSVRERATGDAVEGASVRAGALQATTDAQGEATLPLEGAGPWLVEIAAEGLSAVSLTLESPPERPVKVWLVQEGGDYEVIVEGLKRTADPTRHSVDGEMALETPGTLDDSVRLVQSLPGVTVQREYSPTTGDLSVRGSAPGDSRYYLDGVEIPYLYHFNQYASVFPATQLDQLDLYPSTFSARYGGAVGAIVEGRSKLKPPEELHGSAHLNFVMGGAELSAPVGRGWWVAATGRRSYQDLAGEDSPQYTVWPTFHDFALRAEHGDEQDGTGIFALGAGDRYTRAAGELDVLDPLEAVTTPSLAYRQGFQLLGARRHWTAGQGEGRLVGAVVHHRRQGTLASLGSERLETLALTSRLDGSLRKDEHLGLDLGYELGAQRVALSVDDAGLLGVRVAEEAPILARGSSVDDALLRLQLALYGTARLEQGPVSVMPGLRLGSDSTALGEPLVEPRLSTRWAFSEQGMLKLGGGRYAQRPDSELLLGSPDADLPTTSSWQVSAGWEQAFAGRLEVGLDLYHKWLFDPLVLPIDSAPYAVPRGEAQGIELITRYRLRERFFLWGWLALQSTKLQDPEQGTIPADGDQLLSGGLVASLDVGRWNLGARYRYASGLPFTPLEGSLYDAGTDSWYPLTGPTNSARLPDYHKVDLRAAYTWLLRGWSLSLTAEVWIVPRSSAQLYPTWNYDYTEQGWVIGPTLLPLVGARAKF
jgi:hypothetical protein